MNSKAIKDSTVITMVFVISALVTIVGATLVSGFLMEVIPEVAVYALGFFYSLGLMFVGLAWKEYRLMKSLADSDY